MSNNYIPIYIIAYPKSGSTWLQRLVSDTLNSPYGNGYRSEQKLVFPDSSYNGPYKILHSHYSRMDKPNYITKDSKIFYIIRDPRDEVVSAFFSRYKIDEELVLKREFCSKKSIKQIFWRYIIFYLEINKRIRSWGSIFSGNDITHFLKGIFFY